MGWDVDEKWIKAHQDKARQGQQKAADPAAVPRNPIPAPVQQEPKRRNKYGNEKTEINGERFDSKHEAKIYEELRLRCMAGEYISLARQVAFYLPGNIKYIADFVCMKPDHTSVVFDAKSEATRKDKVYRIKRKLMAAVHKIEILEV